MKKRPLQILILAWIQWFDPIANVLFYSAYFHVSPWLVIQGAWFHASWLGRFTFFLAGPLLGITIYLLNRWSFLVATACASLLFLQAVWNCYTHANHVSWVFASVVFLLQLSLLAYLLIPKVRMPYFNKNLRWWEHKPRYRASSTCSIRRGEKILKGDVYNLSEGGMFLLGELGLKRGDSIVIEPEWSPNATPIDSEVVHTAALEGHKGVGVLFKHTPDTRTELKRYLRELKKQGTPSSAEPRNYFKEVKELLANVTKGKGLVPEIPQKKFAPQAKDKKAA